MSKMQQIPLVALGVVTLIAVFSSQLIAGIRSVTTELERTPELTLIYPVTDATADKTHQPGLPDDGRLRVYWFWSANSPCARDTHEHVTEILTNFDNVEVFIVHSNANERIEQAQRVAQQRNFSLPIYRDENASFAIAVDARITPEAIVLDANGIVYRGRTNRGKSQNFVAEAIATHLAGESVSPTSRAPSGCPIQRP